MPHLVSPIDIRMSISEALAQIREAHKYLVEHGMEALADHVTRDPAYWGTEVKRIRVQFPDAPQRPIRIHKSIKDHSLTEVYNQCATMERLMDGLQWAKTALPDYEVLRCHPTTSSVQKAKSIPDDVTSNTQDGEPRIPDHDLVLVNARNELACFEVSDVANKLVDGNRKEKKI